MMKSSEIPRMDLAPFTSETFTVPVLEIMYYALDKPYFIVGDRESFPVVNYISPNRRNFFKIFHMTGGAGILTIGLHRYEVGPGSIAFLHPDEIMSWQALTPDTDGHFCMVHPKYLEHDAEHFREVLNSFPFFKAEKAVVKLSPERSVVVNGHFATMLQEERQQNDDKKEAILLNLQLIMVETQRAGKNLKGLSVPDQYNYIYKFLELLEANFQLEQKGVTAKYKTASEFADQLNVHPNYLNSLVKQHTGKTLREHIQDRMLYEAKALLMQSDWEVNNIGYGLGFSGPAAFTTFFKNKENMSPSQYRKNAFQLK